MTDIYFNARQSSSKILLSVPEHQQRVLEKVGDMAFVSYDWSSKDQISIAY